MRSTDPPQGAGARNGRVIYRAGANRFGGTMQLGLRRGGLASFVFGASPFLVGHVPFSGSGPTLRRHALGGSGAADAPETERIYPLRGVVTRPTMVPAPGSPILYPGPWPYSGGFYLPVIATGPMGTQAGQVTTHYGFAHTTGTVIAQQTAGSTGQDFFTVMGSDARTALGAGNLSLVAGGLSFRRSLAYPDGRARASFDKVRLTLAPPAPSLSPAGLAVAAALVLLAAGFALRRRLG